MCTDATWIHNKLNAYLHSRDTEEFGDRGILQHGLEFIYTIFCHTNQAEHAFVCQWIYYMCKYHMKLLKVYELRRYV